MLPLGGTLGNLQVMVDTAPGAGTWTFTVDLNGAATGVTCNFTGATTTCSDNANTVIVNQGDEIDLDAAPSGGPAPTNVTYSFSVTP
jgi:hypothetical protein